MKVVLSRLDRIGDLVLSTPAIASVRRSWPDAHVTIVCSRRNAAVVEESPDVDEVLVAPSDVKPAAVGAQFAGRCDVAIALAPCAPDFTLVGATHAPRRVGYTYVRRFLARATGRLYLTDMAISNADPDLCEKDPAYSVPHEVDQVLELVRLAGGRELARELVVPVRDEHREAVASLPGDFIAFHLGARWFAQGSTLASVLELLRDLRRSGRPVVVTCGPDARHEARVIEGAGIADAVLSDRPFLEWAAAFERSRLVITVDTGATHVASAMKKPAVVVFERRWFRLSAQEWAPYRVPSVLLCKPRDESDEALRTLRENVMSAVESLLAAQSATVPA